MDDCQLYSALLGLKPPWMVERVSLDSVKKTVDIYILHEKGSKLLCPVCRKESMVYDHLRERAWRDLDSIEFMTLIHAYPPRISCQDHGIKEAVMPWNRRMWGPTRPEHVKSPDEKWQTHIMYLKIRGRFFYLVIFIDEYSRYIVHNSLLTSMDADSVSPEAQISIEKLRKDSIALPIIQSDNGSSFIAYEFKIVLKKNNLTQKLIRPHTPEQNGIIERANKTMRESLIPVILTNYGQTKSEICKIVEHYNNKRKHSSLHYLTPAEYYRGNPDELLRIRESKIEKARILRRERNMKERKGGEMAGTGS